MLKSKDILFLQNGMIDLKEVSYLILIVLYLEWVLAQRCMSEPFARPRSCYYFKSEPGMEHSLFEAPTLNAQESANTLIAGDILIVGGSISCGDYYVCQLHEQTISCYLLDPMYPYIRICDRYGNRYFNHVSYICLFIYIIM